MSVSYITDYSRSFITDRSIPEPNSGCWLWTEGVNGNGYGQVGTKHIRHQAHRISYTTFVGEIPNGLHVLHKCDTPSCVNPDHLFLGTHQDNMRDKTRKGRALGPVGESHPKAKLTEDQVYEIRRIYRPGVTMMKDIANMYGVNIPTIGKIVNRQTWRHLPDDTHKT